MSRKKIALTFLPVIAVMPVLALASPVARLHEFQADTPVVASEFNENFSALAGAVDDNDARIVALETEGPVVARCASSAATPLPLTEELRVNFDQCAIDTHSAVTTGSSWAFVAPRTGNYRVSSRCDTNTAIASAFSAQLSIVVGAEVRSTAQQLRNDNGANLRAAVSIDDIVHLEDGDSLHLIAEQTRSSEHTLRGDPLFVYVSINELR